MQWPHILWSRQHPVENPKTQDIDNVSEDESQDEDLITRLLHKTADLKQLVEDKNNELRKPYMI